MAIVKIEGKEIPIDDEIVKAGIDAVKAVLAASGFPAVENADIRIEGPATAGGPTIVKAAPRSTGKGAPTDLAKTTEEALHNLARNGGPAAKRAWRELNFRHMRRLRGRQYPVIADLEIGDRVRMAGDVFGEVTGSNDSANLDIKLDGEPRSSNIHPGDVLEIVRRKRDAA